MADTFGQIWNRVLLFAPDLPPVLAQEFVKNTYRVVLGDHSWMATRKDAELLLPNQYTTGTVTVVNGSPTITGSGTAFTTAMIGRQLIFSGLAPFYTITAVDAGAQTLTIDRNYPNVSASALTYEISQAYVEFPTDLYVLERVRDQLNGWYLITQVYDQQYLDRVDSRRQSVGTPALVCSAPARTDSNGVVIPRYEFWPRAQATRFYTYRYRYLPEFTANSDVLIQNVNPEVLVYGALRLAAAWPGTSGKPNPYFSQETHAMYTKMYDEALQNSIQRDLEQFQDMITLADDPRRTFPFDAKFIQNHIW